MPGLLSNTATPSWHRPAFDAAALVVGALAAWRMAALNGLPDWTAFSVILLLACVGSRMRLQLPGLEGSLSLWFPFGSAAILDQPAWSAFLLLSAAGTFDRLTPGRALRAPGRDTALEALVFVASTAVSTLAATSAVAMAGGEDGLFWAARAALAAVVYFVVWSVPAALRRAVHAQASPWKVWNRQYFWAGPVYLLAPCGALVAHLLVDGRNSLDAFLGLSIIAGAFWYLQAYFPRLHERQDHVEKLARVREKALETLAVAIEAKDGSTAGHLERVKLLAGRLARASWVAATASCARCHWPPCCMTWARSAFRTRSSASREG